MVIERVVRKAQETMRKSVELENLADDVAPVTVHASENGLIYTLIVLGIIIAL